MWIGGLGYWTILSDLEREFERFGIIKKIEWKSGDSQAIITYENIGAAQAAVKDMRGYPLGGPDKRIRTDFAGVEQIVQFANSVNDNGNVAHNVTPTHSILGSPNSERSLTWNESVPSPNVGTISLMTQGMTVAWQGTLVLRKNSFAVKLLYTTDGESKGIDGLMTETVDETGNRQFILSRKFSFRQSNLERLRMSMMDKKNSTDIFLAIPWNTIESAAIQNGSPLSHGQLRDLVKYFKQKEVGGIANLKNRELGRCGTLYALPPCEFSCEVLKKSMPGSGFEETQDDYLVIVAIISDWDGND